MPGPVRERHPFTTVDDLECLERTQTDETSHGQSTVGAAAQPTKLKVCIAEPSARKHMVYARSDIF